MLEDYASARGSLVEPLPPGSYRTIHGNDEEQKRLVRTKAMEVFRASSHMSMGRFSYDGEDFVGLLGFDFDPELPELIAVDGL